MMQWKKTLKEFEQNKKWDAAIAFMVECINEHVENLDVYLSICYLLMNLVVEEDYDESKHDYYAELLKKYFDIARLKFSHDPEYLYYMGRIAAMSEWYLGLEPEDVRAMIEEAAKRDPTDLIYQWDKYYILAQESPIPQEATHYAHLVLQEDSPIKKILMAKGSLGEYILGMMTSWSKRVIEGKVSKIKSHTAAE